MGYVINKNYTWKPLKESVVILDLKEGSYYTLNDTASLIWKKIMEGLPDDEIAKCVIKIFECGEEEALSDIQEYIESCVNEGILEKE
jgi:hypothetical protein